MRVPKMTVRRLMIATAIVALCLGVADELRMRARSARDRSFAVKYGELLGRFRVLLADRKASLATAPMNMQASPGVELIQERIAQYENLKRVHEYRADHPRESYRGH
ncbi:hypothetical protein ACYOEI_08700 [Singulisphaera rosea]